MKYTVDEVLDFVEQEDVRFVRLAFCDTFGRQKNVAILPGELRRAFTDGIAFDASAIRGFSQGAESDLFLHPIASTLTVLPWRSLQGKVVRMFCKIRHPDGTPFARDSHAILSRAVDICTEKGVAVNFGSEYEFYLFETDERGDPTKKPLDRAGYMDVSPDDRGEDIRREICQSLMEMGIHPEASHHEEGPGQNEIDFRYSDALTAADNAVNFIAVVKAAAARNGLFADFSPKPLPGESGSGFHINISVKSRDGRDLMPPFMAGVMEHIKEITAFLNPTRESYARLGEKKAPKYITWSPGNRSQLIRVPAAKGENRRIELRSPDPMANPYIAYALIIHAGLDGVERSLKLPEPTEFDLYAASPDQLTGLDALPASLDEAIKLASESKFVSSILPEGFAESLLA